MTRTEFDTWIEQHLDELRAVAGKLGSSDPEEAAHTAVLRALSSSTLASLPPVKVWPWMVDAVRSAVFNARRGSDRHVDLRRALKRESRAGAFRGWKRPAPRAE